MPSLAPFEIYERRVAFVYSCNTKRRIIVHIIALFFIWQLCSRALIPIVAVAIVHDVLELKPILTLSLWLILHRYPRDQQAADYWCPNVETDGFRIWLWSWFVVRFEIRFAIRPCNFTLQYGRAYPKVTYSRYGGLGNRAVVVLSWTLWAVAAMSVHDTEYMTKNEEDGERAGQEDEGIVKTPSLRFNAFFIHVITSWMKHSLLLVCHEHPVLLAVITSLYCTLPGLSRSSCDSSES